MAAYKVPQLGLGCCELKNFVEVFYHLLKNPGCFTVSRLLGMMHHNVMQSREEYSNANKSRAE